MKRVGVIGTDPIADALARLEVRSSIFCLSELRAPWGFRVEGTALAKFHLVLEGTAWLRVDGRAPTPLRTGDVVLLPRGHGHAVSDELQSAVTGLEDLIAEQPVGDDRRLQAGGSGASTQLLCGGFMVAGEGALSLLELVPDVLCVDGQSVAATTWLAPLLTAMEHEVAGGSPGVSAIQSKVADVFVSQALRSWLVGAERTGLLPAAVLSNDETIMCAIDAIENNLGGKWTIDKLASTAGLSRTAFVTRFRRVVGDSPMHYVSRLRVSAAAGLLTTSRLSLHEVAIATGYDSDASLSKAFRRQLGVAPGAYRAAARQPAISVEPASVGRAADESSRGAAGGGTERPTSRSDP